MFFHWNGSKMFINLHSSLNIKQVKYHTHLFKFCLILTLEITNCNDPITMKNSLLILVWDSVLAEMFSQPAFLKMVKWRLAMHFILISISHPEKFANTRRCIHLRTHIKTYTHTQTHICRCISMIVSFKVSQNDIKLQN